MLLSFIYPNTGNTIDIIVDELNGFVEIQGKKYLWITIPTNNISDYNQIYFLNETLKFPEIDFGGHDISVTFPVDLIESITR